MTKIETIRKDLSKFIHTVYLDKMRTYGTYRLLLDDNIELTVKLHSNRTLQFLIKLPDRSDTFIYNMDDLKTVSESDIRNRILSELEYLFKV